MPENTETILKSCIVIVVVILFFLVLLVLIGAVVFGFQLGVL